MAQFDVCVNIDPMCTVLTIRDATGQVVHLERKPPRWGLKSTSDDFDWAAIESALIRAGYRRPTTAEWVRGHWSVHTVVDETAISGVDAGAR
ncbi:type II secretory pathway component PulJ [Rhodococcus sp. LBL1]|uniref:Type II secretory pathway component PulJ n=1 Tax=Prescottella agglutinans TaxID=1644129 RepID=A0ABT6MF23_9NOCA|nr:hypothetical protein [Prescottella agglutinans]MDH6282485.1 type II secretory pathway component PulJ [Prescottella agglutinans]MDH6679078.1 type II secretory pathway component PulJ [Rhodococcus sp. LBL1]MDH6685182.1 type II secretory pathway component PulJ [Rhodococcus sp. LBL2]